MKTQLMDQIVYQSRSGTFSTRLAIASFAIGTLLLIFQRIFPNNYVPAIGFFFVAAAVIINSIVFCILLFFFLTERENREYYAVKIMILLANIPIAYLYLLLIFEYNFIQII